MPAAAKKPRVVHLYDGYTAIAGGNHEFEVITPSGESLGNAGSNLAAHEKAESHLRRSRMKIRACLTCGKAFTSFGPGHRLCANHRHETGGLI